MKKRSRLLCLILSLVLAFTIGLTACGGGGGETPPASTDNSVNNSTNNSQGGGGGRDEGNGTTITFWGSGLEAEQQVFQGLVDTFNDTIGAQNEIYVEYSPQNNVHEAIGNRFKSDTCPDVFYVGDGDYKKYVELDYLLDITDKVEASTEANPYDMWDSIYDRYYYNKETKRAGDGAGEGGRWYGLPKDIGPTVLYYNETMMKNAGVTIISLAEDKVPTFNADQNYADDKGNTFNSLGLTSAIPAKGYFVQGDKMIFNNQIAMSWEEVRALAQVISLDASTSTSTVYGYHTEWWFAYGWSVGGDCIQYVDVSGTADADKYLNNGVYDFTLVDDTDNFMVAEGKNFSINGKVYLEGETISYQDKLTNEYALLNITNKASTANYDAAVLAGVADGTLVKLPSQRAAFLEFVLLSTKKTVSINDPVLGGEKFGYEVCPAPTSIGSDGAKTTTFKDGKLGMLVDGRWNVTDFRANVNFEWDVAPLPIYKAYDDAGNVIARGKEAGHSGSVALAINSWLGENNPAKAEAAWKFVEYLAGEAGQTQQSLAGFAIPSQKAIAMDETNGVFLNQRDAEGNLLPPQNARVFIRAAEHEGEGDWAYLKNGSAWIDAWAGALNSEVRNGTMTFEAFLTCDAFVSTYAALREITDITKQ